MRKRTLTSIRRQSTPIFRARSAALGRVVAEAAKLGMTPSQRLELAAESAGTIGIAVRRWRRQTETADSRKRHDRR